MSDSDRYILEVIHKEVWSGFYSPDEVRDSIEDILDADAHAEMLRAAVEPEFRKKLAAEKDWPAETDCDRLDQAFAALERRGVLCLQNAGNTMSDGHEDAADALAEEPPGTYFGYAFYHWQDLERALEGQGLLIAFDRVDGAVPTRKDIGDLVQEELRRVGFAVKWDGDPDQRIDLPGIVWRRRTRDS